MVRDNGYSLQCVFMYLCVFRVPTHKVENRVPLYSNLPNPPPLPLPLPPPDTYLFSYVYTTPPDQGFFPVNHDAFYKEKVHSDKKESKKTVLDFNWNQNIKFHALKSAYNSQEELLDA